MKYMRFLDSIKKMFSRAAPVQKKDFLQLIDELADEVCERGTKTVLFASMEMVSLVNDHKNDREKTDAAIIKIIDFWDTLYDCEIEEIRENVLQSCVTAFTALPCPEFALFAMNTAMRFCKEYQISDDASLDSGILLDCREISDQMLKNIEGFERETAEKIAPDFLRFSKFLFQLEPLPVERNSDHDQARDYYRNCIAAILGIVPENNVAYMQIRNEAIKTLKSVRSIHSSQIPKLRMLTDIFSCLAYYQEHDFGGGIKISADINGDPCLLFNITEEYESGYAPGSLQVAYHKGELFNTESRRQHFSYDDEDEEHSLEEAIDKLPYMADPSGDDGGDLNPGLIDFLKRHEPEL